MKLNHLSCSLLLVLGALLSLIELSAQAPDAINYQAIARDATGAPLAEQAIDVRMSILEGATPTTLVYEETHAVTTNATGLFTLAIGQGSASSGSFSSIDWGSGTYHLQVAINTGSGFVELGTMPFLSVPYAMYAAKSGSANIALPFSGSVNAGGQTAFEVKNTNNGNALALTGVQGAGSSIGGMSRAAIWGSSETGHGIVGYTSGNGAYAGVWGRTNDDDGYGIHGSASSGAIAGFFESLGSSPGPALVTRNGSVGIGTDEPEELMQVEGTLFVNSSLGRIQLGYPNNGNQWRLSTINAGEDLQFFSKPQGSSSDSRKLILTQEGRLGLGDLTNPNGQMEVESNSTITQPQLTLTESGADYARLTLRNTDQGSKFWSIAGFMDGATSGDRLNFYHNQTGDILSVRGNGNVGIMTISPTARLHLAQRGQAVGLGFRLDDGVNEDWDITHGFGLRFHYGGDLRGFINANTGAYTQSSDARLKRDVASMPDILDKVQQLHPLSYRYTGARSMDKTIGFMAQDAATLFPELVHYSEVDDVYGINYAGFSVVAIKAIQEQQAVIETQTQKIQDLQQRLATLEQLVSQLSNN